MIHSLIPWSQLTRTGIPPLKVARRPLVFGEVNIPVGQTLDPELLSLDIRKTRLRQFYEQRLLEPVDPAQTSQQYYREQALRAQGIEIPIAPVTPVAAQIVADLPTIEAPDLDTPVKPPPRKGVK